MDKSTSMPQPAQVSIVVPVFNDQDHVAAALESCLRQTLAEIEVIVVDDASTDGTVDIVERFVQRDDRITLVKLETNQTAFQARRVGINAASAPFILFLDGDDELVPETASTALRIAHERDADVVAFGCEVIRVDGARGSRHEASMQPKHDELHGSDIVQTLFPIGVTAQGQLWRYLFDRGLLMAAYDSLPHSLTLRRVNDLPIAFLALMRARKYVSTPDVLYRYFFQRGASGHLVSDTDEYLFHASAIDSIESISDVVVEENEAHPEAYGLAGTYESVRLGVIGRVLDHVCGIVDERLRATCLGLLQDRVGRSTLVVVAADFCQKALPLLASAVKTPPLGAKAPVSILLRTGNLGTGGVQGVLVAQAAHLVDSGFRVTIAVDAGLETPFHLPDGVDLLQITGSSPGQKLTNFIDLCRARSIDVVIDHHVLYNERWPYFAVAAAEEGIPTVGWLHNFALRPVLDGSTRTSFLESYLPVLAMTIVLSRTDVAFWKMLGVRNVAYLPNPASPLLKGLPERLPPRPAPTERLDIVWWGRLQQSTKQVRELVEIGAALRDLGVAFRITVIGPDSNDLKARELHELAQSRGIADNLVTPGALHHDDLMSAIARSHVYVSTSIIEGYPLALLEAQALGLPLVMYELPWLATLENNSGVVSVEQDDRRGAAEVLAAIAADPVRYTELSQGSRAAARGALAHDFSQLYSSLVRGELAGHWSPDPEIEDARLLTQLQVRFVERLILRERRALNRSQAAASRTQAALRRMEKQQKQITVDAKKRKMKDRANAPSVVRTGLRGWLMNFLPTTMRQSSYYARHQYNVSNDQREQILKGQAVIADRLTRIEESLTSSKRRAQS